MVGLTRRITKRIKMTARSFHSDMHFSFRYALLRVGAELGGRIGMHKLSHSCIEKRNQWIMAYLKKSLQPVLDKHSNKTDCGVFLPKSPIWVCWWTGEDTAPPLVKQCIKSIRENAGPHPVILISESNYCDYLDVPEYIIQKVNNKTMCIANFSDYLRFSLLAKHGGLWLDATIFCSRMITEDYFKMPLFTCKSVDRSKSYISEYRWTSFCFGGYKGNLLFQFMQLAFEEYWKTNKYAIDYLLVDYLVNLGYAYIPAIRDSLDSVPPNNLNRDDLQAAMNAALPAKEFEKVLTADTILYKLSWREVYSETTSDGRESIYAYFLKRNIL